MNIIIAHETRAYEAVAVPTHFDGDSNTVGRKRQTADPQAKCLCPMFVSLTI